MRKKKGDAGVPILTGGRFLLAAAFVLVIFSFFGKRLFGFIGETGENAYSIDKGFADLITKVQALPDDGSVAVPHPFTVDDGFYLVGFNYAENTNGKATKPPDCNGIACFCVCTDPTCQKIDVNKNRGRDCRPLPNYQAIVAQKGIKGNDGGAQTQKYVRVGSGGEDVDYFYIKGEKTVAVNLKREKLVNGGSGLYIGKVG